MMGHQLVEVYITAAICPPFMIALHSPKQWLKNGDQEQFRPHSFSSAILNSNISSLLNLEDDSSSASAVFSSYAHIPLTHFDTRLARIGCTVIRYDVMSSTS